MSRFWDFFDRFDSILFLTVSGLITFGALIVYSATRTSALTSIDSVNQLYWLAIGLVAMIIMAVIDYRRFSKAAGLFYAIAIFLLIDVLLFGGGNGVERWIPIGSFHLQPSELTKLILIISLAAYLGRNPKVRFRDIAMAFLLTGLPMALVIVQPNLGTATVLAAILAGTLYIAGIKMRWIAVFILIIIILAAVFYNFHLLKDYQMKRLLVFINPDTDPLGAGYSLAQSKIAIGSGGMLGKGLFKGTQSRLNFIPEHHTDFIFSVVGEELGFRGAAGLIGLYLILLSRSLRIANRSTDRTGTMLAAGITAMFLFQIFVNIGMTVGIMPITGLPLPFVSYGGSALITNMAAVGLLININWRYRPRGLSISNGYQTGVRNGYIKKYQHVYD